MDTTFLLLARYNGRVVIPLDRKRDADPLLPLLI